MISKKSLLSVEVQDEVESSQVCFGRDFEKISKLYGIQSRNKVQFREDQRCTGDSSSKNDQEVQHLMGSIAALNQFISKSAEHCLSVFQTLRQLKNF